MRPTYKIKGARIPYLWARCSRQDSLFLGWNSGEADGYVTVILSRDSPKRSAISSAENSETVSMWSAFLAVQGTSFFIRITSSGWKNSGKCSCARSWMLTTVLPRSEEHTSELQSHSFISYA